MTEAREVAEALGVREAELREAVDDDTTAADVLGRFTPDVPLPEAKAAVEAWISGEPVTQPNGTAPADDAENTSTRTGNETTPPEGDGTADAGESGSTGATGDNLLNRPACDPEGAYRPICGAWAGVDFTAPEAGVYPPALLEREQWMGHREKMPFAPWADRDHPEAAHDKDARWKWGLSENYLTGEEMAMAADDPRLDGRAFLQQDDDPFAFVDGDDVRCPETGAVHPAFVALLEHLGRTYADVSTSGSGAHAYYRGALPDGVKQATFPIDTEPWGANDDVPEIEIYANKHVCVATGDHAPGSGTEVAEWDADALRAILEANGEVASEAPDGEGEDEAGEGVDLSEYDPDATTAAETTHDIRDVLAAVEDLRARDVRLRSSVTEEYSGRDAERARDPTWVDSKSGTRLAEFDDHWLYRKGSRHLDALQVVALEEGIIRSEKAYPAGEDWWAAIEALRDRGAPIPEYVGARREDADPVAVLPPAVRELSTATTWDWQNADAENPGVSKQDVRDRTAEAIADAYDRGDRALVEAIPGAGKSYGAVLAAAETGEPVTICTGRGQKEQYDQYREWAAEFGLRDKRLPAFTETCPTARGDHGDDWKETVMNWYRRGASGQTIHNIAEDALGRPLPCQVAETGEAVECPHRHAWDFNPDEYDLLIGHYSHAHTQAATEGRTVVFDEFPGGAFEEILAPGDLQRAVSHYLGATDELPFEDFTDLMDHRHGDGQRRADALAHYLDGNGRLAPDADETAVFDDSGAHALAPIATAALLAGDDLGNGVEHARFASGQAIYHRETGALAILRPPALQYAEGVVALDGTPTPRMWNRCLGEQLTHREVLADDEKRDLIENGLGARYVRTTEAVKPYNSADHVNTDADAALLEAIADAHDQKPAVITTATAEAEYEADDVTEYVNDTRHYGNVLGSNEYADVRVGAVIGSNHYGDDYLKRWGAYLGDAVERENGKGADLSYTGAGDEILTHMRENETLQAAMRFGRDGNGAVVYVHTDTLPDWVPVEAEGRVLSTHSDGMRDVVDALADAGIATTAEVAAHPGVDVGKRQVRDHLETLREKGAVDRHRDPDDRRRIVWQDDGLHRVNENGDVELEPVDAENMTEDEVAELARTTYYTWEFRNSGADPPSPGAAPGSGAVEAGHPAARGDDPPPKPGD